MVDARLPILAPSQSDASADSYLATLGPASRARQLAHLERLAPIVSRVGRHQPRGNKRGQIRLRPRLSAVPWASLQPAHAVLARETALSTCPTLRAATALLQPLRQVARIALADDRARLFDVLEALRIEGTSSERSDQTFWWEHEPDDEPAPEQAEVAGFAEFSALA